MYQSRRICITVLLTTGLVVAALVVPAVAMATGVNPFLFRTTDTSRSVHIVVTPAGGTLELGEFGSLEIPAGAVSSSTDITGTIGFFTTPERAPDGGWVYEAVQFEPDGLSFAVPVLLSLSTDGRREVHLPGYPPTSRADFKNQRIYGYNEVANAFEDLWPSRGDYDMNDLVVKYRMSHFSSYGLGGDPPGMSTPASSDWSLALLAFAGVGLGSVVLYRRRRISLD